MVYAYKVVDEHGRLVHSCTTKEEGKRWIEENEQLLLPFHFGYNYYRVRKIRSNKE